MTKEWQEATNERALEQKMNPIFGMHLLSARRSSLLMTPMSLVVIIRYSRLSDEIFLYDFACIHVSELLPNFTLIALCKEEGHFVGAGLYW